MTGLDRNRAGIALCVAALSVLAGCREPGRTTAPIREADREIAPLKDKANIAILRDELSTATLTNEPSGGVRVAYRLEPGHSWGSWVTMKVFDNVVVPLDLSAFERVALRVRVEERCSAPAMLRLSLYDVDADGAIEWHYAEDSEVLGSVTGQWVQVVFPLKSIHLAPGIWGGPVNDYKLDLRRIGRVEVNLVTHSAARSEGVFLMKELGALR